MQFIFILGSFSNSSFLQQISFKQEIALMEFFSDSDLIAKLVGFCQEPMCLIMTYYRAGSLDKWCLNFHGFVNQSRRAKVAINSDIGRGIFILHERLVAHCDLKPQNVLVDYRKDRPRFLLTDFGISKILTDQYLASEAFQIRNLRGLTVTYASPEAFSSFKAKRHSRYEKESDLYSFACIIYFILTLNEPWRNISIP
jgi:eukaryotic-like serine/threonine-protein kinase